MKTNWKLFLILLALSVFGVIAIIPYSLTLQGGLPQNLPVPLFVLLAASIIQNIVIFAVAILAVFSFLKRLDWKFP